MTTKSILLTSAGVLVVTGAAAAGALYACWDQAIPLGGMAINYVRSWSAPDKTGKRVWETAIANPKLGESTPAAPIAWNGLVFIGNAGGDNRGVKGRITMSCEATHQNVDVVRVPESELLALIGEARQAFAERCEAGA